MKEKVKNIILSVTFCILLVFGFTNCRCSCDYETVPVDKGVIEQTFVHSGTRVVMRYNLMMKRMMPTTMHSTDFCFVIGNDTMLVTPGEYNKFSVGDHYIHEVMVRRVGSKCPYHKHSKDRNIVVE